MVRYLIHYDAGNTGRRHQPTESELSNALHMRVQNVSRCLAIAAVIGKFFLPHEVNY